MTQTSLFVGLPLLRVRQSPCLETSEPLGTGVDTHTHQHSSFSIYMGTPLKVPYHAFVDVLRSWAKQLAFILRLRDDRSEATLYKARAGATTRPRCRGTGAVCVSEQIWRKGCDRSPPAIDIPNLQMVQSVDTDSNRWLGWISRRTEARAKMARSQGPAKQMEKHVPPLNWDHQSIQAWERDKPEEFSCNTSWKRGICRVLRCSECFWDSPRS